MQAFISYSSKDHDIAARICAHLEARGVTCWIAPRDITPGATYADAIVDAISGAAAFVLLLSDNSNLSRHVHAEVEKAFGLLKPVFPVRIRDVRPSKGLELFVSGSQWIDALAFPLDSKMNELAAAILGLGSNSGKPAAQVRERCRIPEKRGALSDRLRDIDVLAVACNLADSGQTGLDFVPVLKFGRMATTDPSEAEEAMCIQTALKHHIQDRNRRVLNLAVFGPSGSGKTFPIREIARSTALEGISNVEVTLADLQAPTDLTLMYRSVQDISLRGRTAMVFIEGFDTALSGTAFGWLQHLIHTMRDGEFSDNGIQRPLGHCILCFVATRYASAHHLSQAHTDQKDIPHLSEFLSRVDCCFNSPGINPLWPEDRVYIFERAIVLRSLLQIKKRTIEPRLLKALLAAPMYYNNALSLQKILDFCRPIGDANLLTTESLPTNGELSQQVDAVWLRNALKEGIA